MDDLLGNFKPNELIFIYSYIETWSLNKAAKVAGCNHQSMLKKDHVRKEIAQAMKDRVERLQISADWVLLQLVKLYETDLGDIISIHPQTGQPHLDFNKATPEFKAALESIDIKPTEYGTHVKIKIPSKLELLKIIGKHVDVNAFEEKIGLTGNITIVYDKQDAEA